MRTWLIHIGEPLPIDGPVRLFRYGLLAQELLARGGEVVQWAGTLNHFTKQQRASTDTEISVRPGYSVRLMHGWPYYRHVGVRRLVYNSQVARSFARQIAATHRPDVIVVSLPTLELADLATQFGATHGIPTIVDVRDLWPDVYTDAVPAPVRPLARLGMMRGYAAARRSLGVAHSLTAVSESYLQWGWERGRRTRSSRDKVFPLAYKEPALFPGEMAAAARYWDSQKVPPTRGLRCCYFGAFNRTSSLEPFLLALRQLHAAGNTDIELVACGRGPKLRQYERIASGCPAVRLFDWVDQPKLLALAERCDVGISAYSAGAPQSLPNKPIEYMASGLAQLSTLAGGELEQLLEETGSGVSLPNPRPEQIAEQLLTLKRNPMLLARLKVAAANTFRERFDARVVYGEMADHLEMISRTTGAGKFIPKLAA